MQQPSGKEDMRTLRVTTEGERLDRYVAAELPDLSRTAVQRLLEAGEIAVNGRPVTKASHRLQAGDLIAVRVPPPVPVALTAEAIPLNVLYEDADILVVNKEAGMVVHPGAGNPSGTLVNAVLAHAPDLAGVGGELRPGIVHRLDKDTSGVIVIAKHDRALRALQRQFKRREVGKRYLALLIGALPQVEGLIDAPVARDPVERKRMAVVREGKPARTRWRIQQRYRDPAGRPYTLVEIQLLTGRTHQIRVHFSWFGYPLVGDRRYGPRRCPLAAPRQFLHAWELTVTHPITEQVMTFSAPLPLDLQEILRSLTLLTVE